MIEYRCGVVGNPIAHSRSPEIHAHFAEECGISLMYQRILAEPDDFEATVKRFFADGGRGLNITSPFKESAFRLCHSLGDDAQKSCSVNTLFMRNGVLHGENTDGAGLVEALRQQGFDFKHQTIMILGAGGATRGVLPALMRSEVAHIIIVNRNFNKAKQLEQQRVSACSWDNIAHHSCDLIINATSAALHGEALPLPDLSASWAYDMTYGQNSAFQDWARQRGMAFADGWSMLCEQARLSFAHWFGITPHWRGHYEG